MNGPLIYRPIALVGLPGAGKTTVGTLLARHLTWLFHDSDTEIECEIGSTIPQIFTEQGETHFRRLERATIDRLLDGTPLILTTGGGAMADPPTRQLLLARATTVWLDAPPAILAARLRGEPDRPLLAGHSYQRLETLREERESFYRAATHRIDAAPPPEMVLAATLTALAL